MLSIPLSLFLFVNAVIHAILIAVLAVPVYHAESYLRTAGLYLAASLLIAIEGVIRARHINCDC